MGVSNFLIGMLRRDILLGENHRTGQNEKGSPGTPTGLEGNLVNRP